MGGINTRRGVIAICIVVHGELPDRQCLGHLEAALLGILEPIQLWFRAFLSPTSPHTSLVSKKNTEGVRPLQQSAGFFPL